MVKKKSVKKVSKKPMNSKMSNMNSMHHHSCWHWMWAKLSVAAFVLFLITAWPWLMSLVHKVHWGWFLAATLLFCVLHWSIHPWMCKKK